MKIDVPRAVVHEAIRDRADGFELCQMVQKRIARPRHEHFVAGIKKELEEERVSLACAGRQDNARGVYRVAALRELARDGRPSRKMTERRGVVSKRLAQRYRAQNRGLVISDPRARRIGLGEVKRRLPAGAGSCDRLGQGIGRKIKKSASGKHGETFIPLAGACESL